MKAFIYVIIWTVIFITFGIYVNVKVSDFSDKYISKIEIIEKYIENDEYEAAKKSLIEYSKSYHDERTLWYKLLNHDNFDAICLYLNLLDKSILTENKSQALEYIQRIIITLDNILESEKCDFNHIM